ncbi:hypothetical protein [Flavitalea sp.]|nr:hypothetical protein [Flavitalea sp.]
MSFLKQLLTPFVDFSDDEKKKAAANKPTGNQQADNKQAGNQQSGPGQQQAPTQKQTVNQTTQAGQSIPGNAGSQPPDVPAVHPLVTGYTAPTQALKQVPVYAQDGTITGPMPEHEQYFEKLIADANAKNPLFQGTDYKEFIDSKIDIDDIADEAIRYKTAFNILKSSGLTKDKLLSTGQEYLDLIGRDLNAFQGAHSQQYQKEVKQKEQLIDKKVQELQALTIKLNELKKEINQVTSEINLTKEKLNTTKNSFLLAGENKQKEIQTELEKIAYYF